jgi:hypothetical protein
MQDSIGDRTLNLGFRPTGIPLPEARRQQRAHAAIHPLRLTQPLLRTHGAQGRKLAFMCLAIRRRWLRGGHEPTLKENPSNPSMHARNLIRFARVVAARMQSRSGDDTIVEISSIDRACRATQVGSRESHLDFRYRLRCRQ